MGEGFCIAGFDDDGDDVKGNYNRADVFLFLPFAALS
jgi:hypothetical protein